jgi:hypothetical protein
VVALAALMSHRPGARPLLWIWAALLSLTGGLASVVWGGTGPIIGLVAALFTGAIAAGIVWLALEGWKDGATERR